MANRDSNENIVFSNMLDKLINQKLNENKISIKQSDLLKAISNLLSNFDFYKKEVNNIDEKIKSLKSVIKIRALTPEEQSAIVSVIAKAHLYDMPFKNIYIMMLFLGLRVHEVVALTQNDINFKKETITINKVLTTEGKKIVVKDNYEDSRTIKINKLIMPYIEEQYNYANGNENKMLFLSKVKTLIDSHNVNNSFKKILNKLNIENASISSLRYSYRDNCLSSGISKTEIQKNMGHIEF